MQVIVNDILRSRQWVAYDKSSGFTVGRSVDNDVVLSKSRFISSRVFAVDRASGGWWVTVSSDAMPIRVDGADIAPGKSVKLKPISEISLPGYFLTLRQSSADPAPRESSVSLEELALMLRKIHVLVVESVDLRQRQIDATQASRERLLAIGLKIDAIVKQELADKLSAKGKYRLPLLILAMQWRVLRFLSSGNTSTGRSYSIPGFNKKVEALAEDYDADTVEKLGLSDDSRMVSDLADPFEGVFAEAVNKMAAYMPENVQYYIITRHIKKVVCDMIFGLGPLQDLLEMPGVTEIMVVSPTQIYVEQNGVITKTCHTFLDDDSLMSVLERIVAPLGRRIDRSSPIVDARLADGSRINAIIPPLALKGACMTIRRFPKERITFKDLLEWGSLNESALELLKGVIGGKKNVVISGGTGTGKTTMLNVLSGFIGEDERLVTIEDSAELQLQQKHLVTLESRAANVEGKGQVTIRDLIINSLRMRPDRIIVGECRGAEVFDMLQAMNTGHNGSMTTIHANNPQDAMTRLESMMLMAVDIPLQAVRQQISQALDVVVQLERLPNHQRVVSAIAEVKGINPVTGQIITRIIMKNEFDPVSGKHYLVHNGYIPGFLPELVNNGLLDIERVFEIEY